MTAEMKKPISDESFGPEEVAMLDSVLARVCEQAAAQVEVGDGLRTMLAAAVIEGAQQDIRQPDDLARFALRAIPGFRRAEVG